MIALTASNVGGRRAGTSARALALALAAAALPGAASCEGPLAFDPGEVARHRMLDGAGGGFLLGVASSAHQIEGGTRNDWSDWERGSYPDGSPHVADGASASRAADSWNLWRRDVEAADALGANVYRLGVEWSRLEPNESAPGSGRGAWNHEAAARYREMLAALVAARPRRPRGVAPMLNLWHFTLPPWVAARGGWEWPGAPAAFAAFAARVAAAYGELVDLWCTLNEPNVYAVKGYLSGQWPPGVRDPARASAVLARLLVAHGLAAGAIRAADRADADGDGVPTSVGLAHNVRIFDPLSPVDAADALVAAVADHFYNHTITDALATGRIRIRIPTAVDVDQPAPELRGSLDWLGLNYYTRDRVRARLDRPGAPYESVVDRALARSDMGWEIYPEGLYRLLRRFAAYRWPIIVTEFGLADRGGDRRPGFIRAHVYAVDRARADGVDVRGLLHWSLLDNFEWSHGYRGRFGLYAVDFEGDPTLARRPTPAVATFQEAARNLGLLP